MKTQIIENIKKLIKINPDESIEINPNYLEYFDVEELLDIQKQLEFRKENISKISNNYLDEIYQKTKKDEI
jgi:DNA replicative helicase MCM subunit Mcm2 (Cdc46/Mcm family)